MMKVLWRQVNHPSFRRICVRGSGEYVTWVRLPKVSVLCDIGS